MKLPFFRSSKPKETSNTLIAPPQPPSAASQQASKHNNALSDTELFLEAAPEQLRDSAPKTGANESGIPLSLESIIQQLPNHLILPGAENQFAAATIAIPYSWVIPQLSTGRIAIPLSDLLPLMPTDLLQQPLPVNGNQQTVVLPLAQIVSAIPPEVMARQYDKTVEIESPEFQQFPPVFDNESAPAPEPRFDPEIQPEPPAAETSAAPQLQEAKTEPASGDRVAVSLRSLIAVMPDNLFVCQRKDLWRTVNLDSRVCLPLEPLLPQLKSASPSLPIAIVIAAMPQSLFVSPLPKNIGDAVPLALEEIVPQIHPRYFASGATEDAQQLTDTIEEEIPNPFEEKSIVTAESAVAATTPVVEPVPAPAPEAEIPAVIQPIDLAAEKFEDESLAIFAEKSPALEAATEPSPQQAQPIVEVTPPASVQPVAEVVTDPVVEQVVAPVVEEVARVVPTTESVATPPAEPAPVSPQEPAEPPVDNKHLAHLNRCSFEDLQKVQGIGPALARRIIESRNALGFFSSLDQVRQIPGVGRKTFRALVGPEPHELNRLLGVEHNEELSLQEIARLVCTLRGVEGCILALSDGVLLTGHLPPHLDQNTLSVFAPQLFQKVGRYVRELRVGRVHRLSIFTDQQPLSIFQAGEVYLVVIHDARHYSKALLRRCERISQEIARQCVQRAVV